MKRPNSNILRRAAIKRQQEQADAEFRDQQSFYDPRKEQSDGARVFTGCGDRLYPLIEDDNDC